MEIEPIWIILRLIAGSMGVIMILGSEGIDTVKFTNGTLWVILGVIA